MELVLGRVYFKVVGIHFRRQEFQTRAGRLCQAILCKIRIHEQRTSDSFPALEQIVKSSPQDLVCLLCWGSQRVFALLCFFYFLFMSYFVLYCFPISYFFYRFFYYCFRMFPICSLFF